MLLELDSLADYLLYVYVLYVFYIAKNDMLKHRNIMLYDSIFY